MIPFVLRRYLKKMSNNIEQQQREYHKNKSKEGEVHVDYIPKENKNDNEPDNNNRGEYIDFEEVE
jgi:hypothetical protein